MCGNVQSLDHFYYAVSTFGKEACSFVTPQSLRRKLCIKH